MRNWPHLYGLERDISLAKPVPTSKAFYFQQDAAASTAPAHCKRIPFRRSTLKTEKGKDRKERRRKETAAGIR